MKSLLRPRRLILACVLAFPPLAAAQAQRTPAEGDPLPSAREIVDRFATATSLAKTVEKTNSTHVKGTFSLPAMNLNGPMETWKGKPNLQMATIGMGPVGTVTTGFDGKTAWMVQPMMGARLLSGTELMQAKLEADYDGGLKQGDTYESMRTVARKPFEGIDCYEVELIAKPLDGMDPASTLATRTSLEYYEVASGLLVGTSGRQEGEMGGGPVTSIVSDYKDFGGQLLATKTKVRASGQEFVILIESVEFDTATPTTFTPPVEIQRLIEAAATPKAPAKEAPKAQ